MRKNIRTIHHTGEDGTHISTTTWSVATFDAFRVVEIPEVGCAVFGVKISGGNTSFVPLAELPVSEYGDKSAKLFAHALMEECVILAQAEALPGDNRRLVCLDIQALINDLLAGHPPDQEKAAP